MAHPKVGISCASWILTLGEPSLCLRSTARPLPHCRIRRMSSHCTSLTRCPCRFRRPSRSGNSRQHQANDGQRSDGNRLEQNQDSKKERKQKKGLRVFDVPVVSGGVFAVRVYGGRFPPPLILIHEWMPLAAEQRGEGGRR